MFRFLSLVLVLALATAAATPLPGPPALPDTPAGRAFGAWLQAFDSGDRATYRAFLVAEHPSELKDLDDSMQFRAMSGGFDLKA
ncbi:MAG TPA: hypothetical protein VMH02_01615, partial [Verrucomicrobiae bacterium]|nr:hypothetical protein [Verrucomicrobiae bacterium]